jgi:hypothetical protein
LRQVWDSYPSLLNSRFAQQFGSECPSDAYIVEMTDDIKASILTAHNLRRDRVAKGEIAGFDSVSRMPTMVSHSARWS